MPLLRPRVVRADKPGSGTTPIAESQQDSLLAAIVNWIPVEMITMYKAAIGIIPENFSSLRLWTTAGSIVVTFFWIRFATRREGQNVAWRQACLAPVAFLCWAVATQGDVVRALWSTWESWMGLFVLVVGTVLLPLFDGILRSLGVRQN
jgi:hypothetical protein